MLCATPGEEMTGFSAEHYKHTRTEHVPSGSMSNWPKLNRVMTRSVHLHICLAGWWVVEVGECIYIIIRIINIRNVPEMWLGCLVYIPCALSLVYHRMC